MTEHKPCPLAVDGDGFEVEGKQYMDRLAVLAQKLLDNSGILVNATEGDA